MKWIVKEPHSIEELGLLRYMLSNFNEKPAREQFNYHYKHGGGWRPIDGFEFDKSTYALTYPGDEPMHPWASTRLRYELILIYPYSFVAIVQPDGSFEVARMD